MLLFQKELENFEKNMSVMKYFRYSVASVIRTLHLPDEFCLEQNYETLFCTNNLEFCIPDSEGLFLPQTLIMRYKIPHLSGL